MTNKEKRLLRNLQCKEEKEKKPLYCAMSMIAVFMAILLFIPLVMASDIPDETISKSIMGIVASQSAVNVIVILVSFSAALRSTENEKMLYEEVEEDENKSET